MPAKQKAGQQSVPQHDDKADSTPGGWLNDRERPTIYAASLRSSLSNSLAPVEERLDPVQFTSTPGTLCRIVSLDLHVRIECSKHSPENKQRQHSAEHSSPLPTTPSSLAIFTIRRTVIV